MVYRAQRPGSDKEGTPKIVHRTEVLVWHGPALDTPTGTPSSENRWDGLSANQLLMTSFSTL